MGGCGSAQGSSRAARGRDSNGSEPLHVRRHQPTDPMTVIELVERERARLRMLDAAAAVALALVATLLIIGTGSWLLGEGRWIVLPRGTPMLVWAALLLANGAVFVWASRRLRRELARPGVAAAIEREQTLRAGAVRGVIEVADSGALGRRADRRLSAE